MKKFKNNVIALDFDDCILPSNSNYFGKTDDALQLLEINLKRLSLIIEKYNMKVFITSSWYGKLTLNNNEIDMEDRTLNVSIDLKPYYQLENDAFDLLKKHLDGHVIGLSCGCRETDIRTLVKEGNKVVIIDDWDLQFVADESEDCLFCYTVGLVDGNIGFMIKEFINNNKKVSRTFQ